MAIYGAGSNWDGTEKKGDLFQDGNFVLGWDFDSAKDLYNAVSLLKVGDIIYLKSGSAGSRTIKIKGIGVVTQSFVQCMIEQNLDSDTISDYHSFYIGVRWIVTNEFQIEIPNTEGKLTNIRAATFYEEHLPFVQDIIINTLFP
jgi:hypothetical protein